MQALNQYSNSGIWLMMLVLIFMKPLLAESKTTVTSCEITAKQSSLNKDTIRSPGKDTVHSPQKAALLSAFIPGAGQVYNKKYWKVPIIYAAGATGGYFIWSNHQEYKRFRQAYIYRTDDDPDTVDEFPQASAQQLQVYRDSYRRNMEFSVILTTAAWLLQILDATVDAHLFDFDVSDNLSLSVKPGFIPAFGMSVNHAPALSLSLNIKASNKSTFNRAVLSEPKAY